MVNRIVKVILRGDIGDLQSNLKVAGKAIGDTADKMTAAGKQGEQFRRGLDELGSTAGKIGLGAAAGLGAIVVASSGFESAMSEVQAATHETEQNMESLRETALQAGKDTAFSASEAAAGIENLAKAGVSTAEIIDGGLAGALDLAAAGGMGVAEAAEAAAGAMAQFKLDGEDVPHIADLLAAGAGKAQGEVSDMVMALKQGGTVAAQTGLSLEETTGALAAMAEQSLLGSDAGTSFKTMLASLTPNSDAAAAAMEKYNIHAFDAQGNFVGMTELAGQLRDGLSELTDEQRAVALETIFGSDAVRAASIVYDQGEDGIRKWITAVDDQGYAAETARIKLDNLKGDLEALGGSFETLMIGMGEGSQGMLRGVVQDATGAVNALAALPDPILNATTALLGITAVTGGAAWFGTKVVRGIADTRSALADLDATGSKVSRRFGLLTKGLGTLAAAFVAFELAQSFTTRGDAGDMQRWMEDVEFGAETSTEKLEALRAELERTQDILDDQTWIESFLFGSDNEFFGVGGSRRQELVDYNLMLEEHVTQLEHEARQAGVTATAEAALAGAMGHAAEATQETVEKHKEAVRLSEEVRTAIREQAEAWGGLGASVGDADTTLQEFMTSLEERATALDNFTSNLDWAQKVKLPPGLIQEFIDLGETGAHQLQNLRNATPEAIAAMVEDWKRLSTEVDQNDKEVRDFRRGIDELNRQKVEAKRLRVEKREAERRISEFMRSLKEIPDEVVMIRIRPIVEGSVAGAIAGVIGAEGKADGGTVLGQRSPYGDKVLTGLAPGEEVISNRNGQADAGRTAAKMINAGQLTDAMLGLADGGTVRGYTAGGHAGMGGAGGGSGMGFTLEELTDALLRARPVNWHGTFEDFEKLERDQARRRAVTGVY